MNKERQPGQCPEGQEDYAGTCLPKVDFTAFVVSLASSALVHLGEAPEPESGEVRQTLSLAKHTIDTLEMLKSKTTGNLTTEESRMLDGLLYELRMIFVRKTGA